MKVAIFGLGYVGCTAAGCIVSQGHQVVGIDVSQEKVDALNSGRCPIEEPDLGDLIRDGRAAGLLSAATEPGDELADADIAIVCVGTPSGPDGRHDMRYILSVTRAIAGALPADRARPLTLAYRSTMRPGTMADMIRPMIEARFGDATDSMVELVYNPEFLRESSAIADYFAPPKIVIGTRDASPSEMMDQLHHGIEAPIFHVEWATAEITKFVDNTWHAVKVAYANEIGRICKRQGIAPAAVHAIFKSDTKLNLSAYYTRPGGAFGGSCLPKDVRALKALGEDLGAGIPLIDHLVDSNETHKDFVAAAVLERLGEGRTVLLSGLAFKARTDDLRESPNVHIARALIAAGKEIRIYDPAITADRLVGQNLGYAFTQLPSLERLLIDGVTAAASQFDLAIRTNATFDDLSLPPGTPVMDVERLAF